MRTRRLGLLLLPLALAAAIPQQQRPTFRGGVNLVTVDAYPRKDGKIVEGLTPDDFEVREDDVVQKVEQFEFVRVEPTPELARRDPNSVGEMRREAADPHNRVFVIYLDIAHVDVFGSHYTRRPIMDVLNQVIGPGDLFAVSTWKVPISALTFGRKTLTIEDQLTRFWTWGEENRLSNDPDDSAEATIDACCQRIMCNPGELKRRRRETRALENLKDLVLYLGTVRETRSTMIVVSGGWPGYEPRQVSRSAEGVTALPPIVVQGGKMGVGQPTDMLPDRASCTGIEQQILSQDNRRHYRDVIDFARRSNVVFYPLDPGGLRAPTGGAPPSDLERNRLDSLIALAHNTDGIPIVNTNDLAGGAKRIIDDVSAFYLIGYYSTNAKRDGRTRRITVRVKKPDVSVVARRMYVADDEAKLARAEAEARKTAPPAAPTPLTEAVKSALAPLGRLDTSSTDVFVRAVRSRDDVFVVAEVNGARLSLPGSAWTREAAVHAVVTTPTGQPVGEAKATIAAGARSALLRVTTNAVPGPLQVVVTTRAGDASSKDQVVVPAASAAPIGEPLVFRGTPAAQSALMPVADQLFRRSERVHLEWPLLGAVDRREARLLDRTGQALPIPVAVMEGDRTAGSSLVADIVMSPLAAGDYVVELTATSGTETARRYVAIRVR